MIPDLFSRVPWYVAAAVAGVSAYAWPGWMLGNLIGSTVGGMARVEASDAT